MYDLSIIYIFESARMIVRVIVCSFLEMLIDNFKIFLKKWPWGRNH